RAMRHSAHYIILCIALAFLWAAPGSAADEDTNILFLAGKDSHGQAAHSYYANFSYLARALQKNVDGVRTDVRRGWPGDSEILEDADAVIIGSDAGRLVEKNLKQFRKLVEAGTGIACIHYTLDIRGESARQAMLDAIGGYYEIHWSVNPKWTADFKELPDHPITRGVEPFKIHDEWYYHMRFREDMEGVTPILTAVPPDETRKKPEGPHSGNPHVRERMGMPEHVAWAARRPGGGRGFGFTGLHSHWKLKDENYRTLLLNACLWIAGEQVPEDGVPSDDVTLKDLAAYLQ
ncbi:MAG: ThuA domain-containing protein, partial [Planctomycetota bacterium]